VALLAAGASALLLVACGGDSGPRGASVQGPNAASSVPPAAETAASVAIQGGGGNRADACSLLSKADAEAAAGVPMGDPEKTPAGCNFIAAGQAQPVVFLQIGGKKKDFEFAKGVYKDPIAVSGIGDEGFLIQLGAPVSSVFFVKGDNYYILSITNVQQQDPVRQQNVKDLAKKVAAKG
jgi:hypothetical protein